MSIWERAKAKAADVADLVAGTVGVNRALVRSDREGKKLDQEIAAEAERRGWTPFQVSQEVERDYAAKPFDQPKEREVLRMPEAEPSEQGLRYWGKQRADERGAPEVSAADDVNAHWAGPLPGEGAADPFGPRAVRSAEAMEAEMTGLPDREAGG